MQLGLARAVQRSADLSVVGQGVPGQEARPASAGPSRPLSRASRAESTGSLADFPQNGSFNATYDSNVPPSELRTQNLYIQSLQHRQPQVSQNLYIQSLQHRQLKITQSLYIQSLLHRQLKITQSLHILHSNTGSLR